MEALLKPVTRANKVKGPNNPHFTSCFMNAVLLSMFLPYIPVFDRLFLRGPDGGNNIKKAVRKFVLRLRYGVGTFNGESLRTLTGFEEGQQDAIQFLTNLWSAVDPTHDYAKTGDVSYSTKNEDATTLSETQVRNLFYNTDIGKVKVESNAKMVTVNIADAPRRALVKFSDLVLPSQPARVDNDTSRFYRETTFRVNNRTYREWLEGAVIPTDELKKIIRVTLPSFVVYQDQSNMTQELFLTLYSKIRSSKYFFYSLRAIARSAGSNIVVPPGYSWEDVLDAWVIPDGGVGALDVDDYLINKYLESLYLLGYGGAADRLYRKLGSTRGSYVYEKRDLLSRVASTSVYLQPLQGGKIMRTTAPIIEFVKDVFVLSIARHRGAERMSTRFCPVDNCMPWRDDESFILTTGGKRLQLSSVVINTSEASSATFETHGHYRCYVLIQGEWYAYDDLFHGSLTKARMSTMQKDIETLGSLYFYVEEDVYNARPKSGWRKEDETEAKRLLRPPPPRSSRGGKGPSGSRKKHGGKAPRRLPPRRLPPRRLPPQRPPHLPEPAPAAVIIAPRNPMLDRP